MFFGLVCQYVYGTDCELVQLALCHSCVYILGDLLNCWCDDFGTCSGQISTCSLLFLFFQFPPKKTMHILESKIQFFKPHHFFTGICVLRVSIFADLHWGRFTTQWGNKKCIIRADEKYTIGRNSLSYIYGQLYGEHLIQKSLSTISECEAFNNNTFFAHICLRLNYFELHFTTFFNMQQWVITVHFTNF